MPVFGRRIILEKPNFVRQLPSLPIPMELGSISHSISFEQQPSGSLSYEGITLADKARFEAAYLTPISQKRPPKIDLFGIHLVADTYSYDRTHYIFDGTLKFDRYKVSVSLKGRYEELLAAPIRVFKYVSRSAKKVSAARLFAIGKVPYSGPAFDYELEGDDPNLEVTLSSVIESKLRILECYVDYSVGVTLRPINTGGSWNFLTGDILTDGSNSAKAFPAYNRAIATLEEDPQADEDDEDPNGGTKFTKKEPKTEVLVEQDEDPESPPTNTNVLKTIDSNSVDGSGRKKTRKTTTQVDGTVVKTVTETFGFLYTAADINIGDGVLLSTDPQDFWTLIEYQEETPIYESAPDLALSIRAEVPPQYSGEAGEQVNLVIHPDYEQFAVATALGNTVQFVSSAKYLTQIKTTGWRYARLERETDDLETISLADEPDRKDLYVFKKIPKVGKTQYFLRSSRSNYGEQENQSLPFSVEWTRYEELTPDLKNKVLADKITSAGIVGILKPDPSYIEPLSILNESTESNSFAWAPDPDTSAEDPLPPKITGEEQYSRCDRVLTGTNRYREKTANFTAQNSGFGDFAEEVTFKDSLGRPPEASTIKTDWEQKDDTGTDGSNTATKSTSQRYFVTTDLVGDTPEGGSVSFPSGVKTVSEAKKALQAQLRIDGLSVCQEQKKVAWWYPTIKCGDFVTSGSDRFLQLGGRWRVTGASFNVKVDGSGHNQFVNPWATTDGVSLTLGLDKIRVITIQKDTSLANNGGGSEPNGDPKLKVSSPGGEISLGAISLPGQNRRRF